MLQQRTVELTIFAILLKIFYKCRLLDFINKIIYYIFYYLFSYPSFYNAFRHFGNYKSVVTNDCPLKIVAKATWNGTQISFILDLWTIRFPEIKWCKGTFWDHCWKKVGISLYYTSMCFFNSMDSSGLNKVHKNCLHL